MFLSNELKQNYRIYNVIALRENKYCFLLSIGIQFFPLQIKGAKLAFKGLSSPRTFVRGENLLRENFT